MKVKIYAIGGNLNDKYVGTAVDGATGLSLLDLIAMNKGYACSIHGKGLDKDDASGECSIEQARKMFLAAMTREKIAYNMEVERDCGGEQIGRESCSCGEW